MLADGEMMRDLGQENCKYLGVLEANEIKMKEIKEKLQKEYIRRIIKATVGNEIKMMKFNQHMGSRIAWLKNGYMRKGMEGLITAAPNQALPTQ